jgi:hypothetical protein
MSSSGRAPIFILSCYRTGSTLMRYIFDTHPDVYSPPEVCLGDTAAQLAQLEAGLSGFKLDPARLDQLPAESVAASIGAGRGVSSEGMPSREATVLLKD